ncbi:hypothetical protein MHYP_G00027360 [Metynnis hypsauchen]
MHGRLSIAKYHLTQPALLCSAPTVAVEKEKKDLSRVSGARSGPSPPPATPAAPPESSGDSGAPAGGWSAHCVSTVLVCSTTGALWMSSNRLEA